jgi:hypothetical protein
MHNAYELKLACRMAEVVSAAEPGLSGGDHPGRQIRASFT